MLRVECQGSPKEALRTCPATPAMRGEAVRPSETSDLQTETKVQVGGDSQVICGSFVQLRGLQKLLGNFVASPSTAISERALAICASLPSSACMYRWAAAVEEWPSRFFRSTRLAPVAAARL